LIVFRGEGVEAERGGDHSNGCCCFHLFVSVVLTCFLFFDCLPATPAASRRNVAAQI
jgi:hypothetical protein